MELVPTLPMIRSFYLLSKDSSGGATVNRNYSNNRLGIIDYCALTTSRRRVGNSSLEPRPAAEPVMNNNQLIRDGN